MKFILGAIILLLPTLLVAQEAVETSADKEQHPAVKTLVAWAGLNQKNAKGEVVEIFDPKEIKALESLGGPKENVAGEMRKFVRSHEGDLTFKPTPNNPKTGMILIDGRRFLPMKLKNGKWVGDLLAMMEGIKASAQNSQAESNIASLITVLQTYKILAGTYPSQEQGLKSLVKRPTTPPRPRRWKQTFDNEKALIDPWGNPYRYKLVDGKPVVSSLGPDDKASDDDITSE